jgi:hypothetical protein
MPDADYMRSPESISGTVKLMREERTEAADTIEALVEALGQCRDRFTEYAREHQRKAQAATHPRDHDERMEKADRNLDMAMVCETALSRARNGGQP